MSKTFKVSVSEICIFGGGGSGGTDNKPHKLGSAMSC